ncbi:hypothetical protein PHMEG_00023878 [Phytophthora megakarya]|uniref:DDE Tnp4 domain-containing protein n=1 Tax=Phytophthora megakarya TaxID=4795 RepID=A0A225VFV8_9STRA|nr:hypothetical protein PHMEG_00023878 [Phytophthora megakarya]
MLLRKSQLEEELQADQRFRGFLIYGDQAYGRTDVFASPFKGSRLTRAQATINASMAEVRTSVEWSYGQVVNYWSAVDFKRKMAVGQVPVEKLYKVAVILTNCITILRGGNNNSQYLDLDPPTLDEYFSVYN